MSSGFNNPFRDLKKTVKIPEKPLAPIKPVPPPVQVQEPNESEEDLFSRHMQEVTRLKSDGRVRVNTVPPPLPLRAQTEENEALAELYDLVAGRTGFDITDTDEYVEACVSGLDIRLVRKLRSGEFSRQAALDLHGMTSDAAQVEVEQFVLKAVTSGLNSASRRCSRVGLPTNRRRPSTVASTP